MEFMILQQEFYFVRHGQTDYNALKELPKHDCPDDIPLNATGRSQAASIEPIIATLPIQTICASPLPRAQETKRIITPQLQAPHHEINDLSECSLRAWYGMIQMNERSPLPQEGEARQFLDRVQKGLHQALVLPGPALIVAHGGVHLALCILMGIREHEWIVGNCVPVHFSLSNTGKWTARLVH